MLTFPLELMMTILSADMNDVINKVDRAMMEEIAKTDDHPVLMINQNLYTSQIMKLFLWRAIFKSKSILKKMD